MSHDIAEIGGEDAIAYTGQTPWHRLGTRVAEFENVDDALQKAKLDWDVHLRDMFILNKDGYGYKNVPIRRAVVRWEGEQPVILGTVGETYEVLNNRPAFSVLQPAMEEHGVKIEVAGALGQGQRVWMLAKLPHSVEVAEGDTVDSYFLISTGHDGATPYVALPTPIRVVCQNTLTMALRKGEAMIRLRHTGDQDKQLAMVGQMINDLIKTMTITGDSFRKLAERKMNHLEVKAYIDSVLGIEDGSLISKIVLNRMQQIKDLVYSGKGHELAPETAWAAYNAFTEYVDHKRTAEVAQVGNPKRIRSSNESALFGANAALKARALDWALALVD